jgi:hypothetical protein
MRKIWMALLFLAGGIATEIRNPITCETVPVRQQWEPRREDEPRSRDKT